jgi:hypothetical protein
MLLLRSISIRDLVMTKAGFAFDGIWMCAWIELLSMKIVPGDTFFFSSSILLLYDSNVISMRI